MDAVLRPYTARLGFRPLCIHAYVCLQQMSECVYICMQVCIGNAYMQPRMGLCIHACMQMHVSVSVHTYASVSVIVYVQVGVFIHVSVSVPSRVCVASLHINGKCMYIRNMYTQMCLCLYLGIHTYVHIHICSCVCVWICASGYS